MEKPPRQLEVPFHSGQQSTSADHGSCAEFEWTEAEEKRVVRKIDLLVMPPLILAFMALQLDRGNIGKALTDYFLRDVGITQDQFNVGTQLLSAGIVILEIPSNLILYRVGPRVWISGQIFAWGLVALFQAFQKGYAAFLTTRLLLGLCESGFIPAGLYCITMWYKRDETSKRFSWYFIGNLTAAACSGLIAYGILQMRGICGLAGWQWMFIIEGLFTCLVSIAFVLVFPKGPDYPVSYLGFRVFSEREKEILVRRIHIDDPGKQQERATITRKELTSTLSNWRIYPHVLLTLSAFAPVNTLSTYAPTLINSYGYGRLKANGLVSVGSWIGLVGGVLLGMLADKTGRRGLCVLGGVLGWFAFAIASRMLVGSTSESARYGTLTMDIALSSIWHPINGSWLALNARSAGERSITMAMFVMSANAAGIIGGQLFQSKDSPSYKVGWTVIVCLVAVGVVFTFIAIGQYWGLNRRIVRHKKSNAEEYKPEGTIEKRLYVW